MPWNMRGLFQSLPDNQVDDVVSLVLHSTSHPDGLHDNVSHEQPRMIANYGEMIIGS